ncbi:iron-sulfur cluster assembly scaffold protein [Falsirhodobacter algicola]|uniref:Iron-sulfur cluster assembly scaffold protein n=1 Tax=Falsirhodobacter algicola TaxID=2692330 RepID=A0A8J8MS34_9RHOB|nr:iron-sulfur cluster assembly scaffold protein [Falsirhodobacter algicola]QUS35437.1 iron-sulfur cluster assembly scaffold protein [Falsirhodobacter algicola]
MSTLYSTELLALASDIGHAGRLPAPTGSATRRSPTCGSTVTVDVVTEGERLTAFAQEVRTCLLGQASAALLGRCVFDADLPRLRAEVAAMLAGGPICEAYAPLAPAAEHPARHAAILLPMDAAIEAMEKSRQR